MTIDFLSTLFSGYCVPVRLGGIYHLTMAIGKTPIGDFADGATKAFGKDC
jgi:hypothetical protein